MRNLYLLVFNFIFFSVYSKQDIWVNDNDYINITISQKELSLITSEDVVFEKIWSADDSLNFTPDLKKGDIFIKPRLYKNTYNFFLRDQDGHTYNILATTSDIPAETIVLHANTKHRNQNNVLTNSNDNYVNNIKNIIKKLAIDIDSNNYLNHKKEKKFLNLFKETVIELVSTTNIHGLRGDAYKVNNISQENINLNEQLLMQSFPKELIAVSIEKELIEPNHFSIIYIVYKI